MTEQPCQHIYPVSRHCSIKQMGPAGVVDRPLPAYCWLCRRGECMQVLVDGAVFHQRKES